MEYRRKKCFWQKLFIIVALLFVPLYLSLNVINASAISKDYSGFKLRLRYSNGSDYVLTNTLLYSDMVTQVKYLDGVRIEANNFGSVPTNTNYIAVSGKVNLVAQCFIDYSNSLDLHSYYCPYNNGDNPSLYAVSVNSTSSQFISDNISVYVTDWVKADINHQWVHNRTFTYEYTFVVSNNIPSTLDTLAFFFTYPGRLQGNNDRSYIYYFQGDPNNKMLVDFTTDKNTAILQQQVQIQQLILEALNNMNNSSNEYYDQYYESVDNIDNQSASDIPNSENSQTTSIIGTISSFVSAIGTVQTGSCQMTLPFPSFLGGDTTVNPCTGKDKAPTIVTIGSSMFLIGIFIPFAFVVLKMIYNEIRSFTNG